MKILITGSCGFIGTNLTLRCLEEDIEVVGVDNNQEHIDRAPESVQTVSEYDDFSSDCIFKRIRNQEFDIILHEAAVPRVSYSVEHPVETTKENLFKTVKLLEVAAGNCKRLVFASSSSIYGNLTTPLPTKESDRAGSVPLSPYAMQKKHCEDYLKLFCDLYDLDAISLRYFNVIGPHQYGDSPYATALSSWCHRIKEGVPLRFDGTGEQSRDMAYIDNVVHANMLAAKSSDSFHGEAINIACGDRTSNNEIMDELKKRYPDIKIEHAPFRPGDVMHTQADVKNAWQIIGYEPLVRFWDGFEKTLSWWGL